MASTFSSLKFELIGTGEQDGTWGTTTNTNLGTAIEQAITGTGDVTFSGSDVTLTLSNTNASQTARNLRLVCVGTSSGARQLIVPAIEKQYIIKNELADTVTVKNSTGSGIAIPSGKTSIVFNNGTDVLDVTTFVTSLSTSGNVAVGGTLTAVSPAFTGTPTAPTASPGTNTTQIATTAFVLANGVPSGSILMWSGSILSIPSGWYLCDGSNSTPDLRNRFIVGAGSTYNVGVTGGSADAVVVSHTHTASVTDPGHTHATTPATPLVGTVQGGHPGGAAPNPGTPSNLSINTASTGISVGISTTGSSGTNANLPPYYALAYIMKA